MSQPFCPTVLVSTTPVEPVQFVPSRASLVDLPVEVLLKILSQLDCTNDLVRISETNTRLRCVYQQNKTLLLPALWATSSMSYVGHKDIYEDELKRLAALTTSAATLPLGIDARGKRRLAALQIERRVKFYKPSGSRSIPEILALIEGELNSSLQSPYQINATVAYYPEWTEGACKPSILLRLSDSLLRRIEYECVYPWRFLQQTDSDRYEELLEGCEW
jgi:F-box-like